MPKSVSFNKSNLIEGFNQRAKNYGQAPWLNDDLLLGYPISLLKLHGDEIALELGVGSGHFSQRLIHYVKELYGIDVSENMLSNASLVLPQSRLLKFDAEEIGNLFLENTFDTVVSRNLLHHVRVKIVLAQIKKLLKPNGKLLIVEASTLSSKDTRFFLEFAELLHPGHTDYPSHRKLISEIRESGFEIIHSERMSIEASIKSYLSSTSRTDTQKQLLLTHFLKAPETIKRKYKIDIENLTFQGNWTILVARKN